MKVKVFSFLAALAIVAAAAFPMTAQAGAYETAFTTSVTYQNVDSAATTTLTVQFFAAPDATTPIEITRPNLNAGASTSLFLGSVNEVTAGFQGSAIMQSDKLLVATMVQLPQNSTTVRNRPLSNGFSAGSEQVLLATVLKGAFGVNSVFSVQNVGAAAAEVDLLFYNTSAEQVYSQTETINAGAAYYFDAALVAGLPAGFNGSAVINANGGQIVAGVMELAVDPGITTSAVEGVASGGRTFYMPSALCKAYGADTSYAIQNTSLTTATDVTVTYSNGIVYTQNIGAGAKKSFVACAAPNMPENFSGAAVITSTAADVIAVGKAYGSGLSTAFVGASSGSAKLALPYVRFAADADYGQGRFYQRTYITIQNIGSTALSNVTVTYINPDGSTAGTHTIASIEAGAKANSNASSAGLLEFGINGGAFGGGAIVNGGTGAQLAVVARVSTNLGGSFASEDYNGIAVP